jgi:hypothetical protein
MNHSPITPDDDERMDFSTGVDIIAQLAAETAEALRQSESLV